MIQFSVIIPLYNKAQSVSNTINSVLNQSYSHFELIIVNDGSTDNSLEIVKTFEDKRITLIDIPNSGVSNARNTGILHSKNEYITFLDADDLWFENCLSEFVYLIENFRNATVFCTSHTLTVKDIKSRDRKYYIDNFWKQNAFSYARNNTAVVCTGCIAIKKECFDSVSGFDTKLTHGEDLDLWSRLADKFVFAKSEVVTLLYRLDAENRSDKTKLRKRINFVKRSEVAGKLRFFDYGRICFFEFYYNIFKNPTYCMSLLFHYGDWIFLFLLTVLYVRILKK